MEPFLEILLELVLSSTKNHNEKKKTFSEEVTYNSLYHIKGVSIFLLSS